MPKGDARDSIATCVTKGIIKAASSWETMSAEPLASAPEYYTSTVVAQTLSKSLTKSWVCLEWGTLLTVREARKTPKRGRLRRRLDGTKRFDLVVFYQDGRPRCAIEIKHLVSNDDKVKFSKKGLGDDLLRLANAIIERADRNSSLAQGCLGIYLECGETAKRDGSPRERIERWMKELESWAKDRVPELSGRSATIQTRRKVEDGNGLGGAYGALVIDLRMPIRRVSAEG